nr:hypothetical protein CFP56_78285 [Quercus suber]
MLGYSCWQSFLSRFTLSHFSNCWHLHYIDNHIFLVVSFLGCRLSYQLCVLCFVFTCFYVLGNYICDIST